MDKETNDYIEQMQRFANRFGVKTIYPATVQKVNADDTIEVEFSSGKVIDDVRLKSVVKASDKLVLIPAVNSTVLVARIENSEEYVVVAVNEITDINLLIGTVKYKVSSAGFLLQKDNDTLKQILTLIVEAVQQILVMQGNNPDYVKLTQALTKINNLLQ